MSIVQIIENRKSGTLAPSEILRRKKMLELKKNPHKLEAESKQEEE